MLRRTSRKFMAKGLVPSQQQGFANSLMRRTTTTSAGRYCQSVGGVSCGYTQSQMRFNSVDSKTISQEDVAIVEEVDASNGNDGGDGDNEGGTLGEYTGEGDEFGEDGGAFDEVEAALQEIHDLTHAMVKHLDNIKPIIGRSWRGHRQYEHPGQHMPVYIAQNSSSYNKEDMKKGCELFDQMAEKLMPLMTETNLKKMVSSSSYQSIKLNRDCGTKATRSKKNTNIVTKKGTFNGNTLIKMFKHSPFEVEQLRSDMPEAVILATRGGRDKETLKYLFLLMDNPHPFRNELEKKCWETFSTLNPNVLQQK